MAAGGNVIRGEQWKLAFAPESAYGEDPGTAAYTNVFGVVQSATMPDPNIDVMPIWALGSASKRNWYIAYKGKISLNGSIPDIWLLNGLPLKYAIGGVVDAGSVGNYTHTITEAYQLPSLAMHVTYFDSDATPDVQLMRRFLGGKVNRATIEAREGDFLKIGLDEIVFTNYLHNITGETGYGSGVADITPSYPTTQPYLFSYGSLQLGGTEFARLKDFRLSISNNLEPKYYVTNDAANQLPYEYREGRREYQMSCTIDIVDEALYTELVRQGIYSSVYKGFQTIMTFTRGSNDSIVMTLPNNTPGAGGDSMGCLITQAPHNIVTESVVSVPLNIISRNLGIVVTDAIATYP